MILNDKNICAQLEILSAQMGILLSQIDEKINQSSTKYYEQYELLFQDLDTYQNQISQSLENIQKEINGQKKLLTEFETENLHYVKNLELSQEGLKVHFDKLSGDMQQYYCNTTNDRELLLQFNSLYGHIQALLNVSDGLKVQLEKQDAKLNYITEKNSEFFNRILLKENALDSQVQEISKYLFKNDTYSQIKTKGFKNNFIWYIRRDAYDNVSNYVRGGYIGPSPDWDVLDERVWSILPAKGTFLDIGANIGAFCLPAASMGLKGYAIEASEINIGALEKSVMHNSFDITLLHKAVWETTGKVQFIQNGPQGYIKDFIHEDEDYETIDAICLDDYQRVPELCSIKKLDFIKIDIEGSEVAALRGMKHFLQKMDYPLIMVEVNIWNLFCMHQTPKTLLSELRLLGYRPYEFYKGGLFEYNPEAFPRNPCMDYLLIKDIPDYLGNRIQETKKYNPEEDLLFARQQMENFRNWTYDYGINPDDVLPHIALYYLTDFYDFIRDDALIKQYKYEIATKLKPLKNPIFDQMIYYES